MMCFVGALKGRQDVAMPQSLARNLIHLVFSTKNREPVLTDSVRIPLCDYASAVLRDLDSHVVAINAWRDHVHILFALSKNHSLAQVVMEVKRASSKWIKTQGKEFAGFHWQGGYGAFSIGQSGVDEVKTYIANLEPITRIEKYFRPLRRLQADYSSIKLAGFFQSFRRYANMNMIGTFKLYHPCSAKVST